IFTANKKRVKELLRGMITRDLTPQWGAQVRTETVDDPELLQMMRDSNCFNVYVGFESINPRTLKLFQKKQDLAKIERSIEKFHAHKIRIHGMFVVGSDEDDLYYTTIRDWGKKMIREGWKDEENRAYVEWLRNQLYSEARELGHRSVKTVGLPAALLQDKLGQLLQRFLGELGVTVVPLAEA